MKIWIISDADKNSRLVLTVTLIRLIKELNDRELILRIEIAIGHEKLADSVDPD
jgi:hypothetical protein